MDTGPIFHCLLLFLSFTTWLTLTSARHHRKTQETNKLHKTHLCGQDFLDAHLRTCRLKAKLRITGLKRRKKRTVDLVELKEAQNFFHPLRRRFQRSAEDAGKDNAHEECCLEGCDIHEMAEYQCSI